MPHVLVKLWPGKSEQQKMQLADWAEKVYRPDIQEKQGTLYKKPGYAV